MEQFSEKCYELVRLDDVINSKFINYSVKVKNPSIKNLNAHRQYVAGALMSQPHVQIQNEKSKPVAKLERG